MFTPMYFGTEYFSAKIIIVLHNVSDVNKIEINLF